MPTMPHMVRTTPDARAKLVAWVGTHVLPHEADVRSWLLRSLRVRNEVDDIVQEAYCRLAALEDFAHIKEPRAYFFQVVRNIVLEQVRRARVVRIETVTEIESLNIVDDRPSPERIAAGSWELANVQRLIQKLPERCQRVVELRKIRGVPQREIARLLGISEHIVENETAKGVRLILKALEQDEKGCQEAATVSSDERKRRSERD